MIVRKSVRIAGSVVLLLGLAACGTHANQTKAPHLAGPQDPNLRVNAAGYHGHHFLGPVYIPRSSPLGDGTTAYDVTYQDGVSIIGRADTLRHLVAVHQDGTYFFDSTADQIAQLKSGSGVLFTGLALSTVVDG